MMIWMSTQAALLTESSLDWDTKQWLTGEDSTHIVALS